MISSAIKNSASFSLALAAFSFCIPLFSFGATALPQFELTDQAAMAYKAMPSKCAQAYSDGLCQITEDTPVPFAKLRATKEIKRAIKDRGTEVWYQMEFTRRDGRKGTFYLPWALYLPHGSSISVSGHCVAMTQLYELIPSGSQNCAPYADFYNVTEDVKAEMQMIASAPPVHIDAPAPAPAPAPAVPRVTASIPLPLKKPLSSKQPTPDSSLEPQSPSVPVAQESGWIGKVSKWAETLSNPRKLSTGTQEKLKSEEALIAEDQVRCDHCNRSPAESGGVTQFLDSVVHVPKIDFTESLEYETCHSDPMKKADAVWKDPLVSSPEDAQIATCIYHAQERGVKTDAPYGTCAGPSGYPKRTREAPCESKAYHATIANTYLAVTKCLDGDKVGLGKEMMPFLMQESSFHYNAFSRTGAAGICQLTGPALQDLSNTSLFASKIAFIRQLGSRPPGQNGTDEQREACSRINRNLKQVPSIASVPNALYKDRNRCGIVDASRNPLYNLLLCMTHYELSLNFVEKLMDTRLANGLTIEAYLSKRGINVDKLTRVLAQQTHNLGSGNLQSLLPSYLNYSIKKQKALEPSDFNPERYVETRKGSMRVKRPAPGSFFDFIVKQWVPPANQKLKGKARALAQAAHDNQVDRNREMGTYMLQSMAVLDDVESKAGGSGVCSQRSLYNVK